MDDKNSLLRSLRSLCTEVLAAHIPDLAAAGDDILPWLPMDVRRSLLAVAKRRRELNDEVLNLLVDEQCRVLDLSGVGGKVSIRGVVSAISKTPNLQLIDISGLEIGPKFIKSLAKCCPGLLGLRMGFPKSQSQSQIQTQTQTQMEDIGDALIEVFPGLIRQSNIAESWEYVAEDIPFDGTLLRLECLVWPDIPPATEWKCLQVAPKVYINPSDTLIKEKQLPEWYNAKVQLDAQFLWEHSSGGWDDDEPIPNVSVTDQVTHIAEKFRLAYESRENRLKRQDARLRRQQFRKHLLDSGSARAIRKWEGEL